MATKSTPTGLRARHSRQCRRDTGGDPCRCKPGPAYEAWVWSRREGRKIYKTFSGRGARDAAKAWRADSLRASQRGQLRPTTRSTVRQAADELIAGMRDGSIRSKRKRPYKPSVIRKYERALGLLPEQRERAPERVLEAVGDVRLSDLDRATVEAYGNRLLAAGYDASTVHNQLDPLRVIYRLARRRGELAIDPLEGLDLPKPKGKRDRIASPTEAAALLEAVREADRALWATAFYAGLRRGELRALRWSHVDFVAGVINVEASWDDVEGEQEVKSEAGERTVPIIGALAPELRRHQMATGRRGGDLVLGVTAADPFCPSTVRRQAREAWEAAGLKPITPHECRHTFASLLIAAGVDAKAVMTYMGHASIKVTYDTYGHLLENARDEAVRRVDAFLGAQMTPAPRLQEV